MKKDIVIIALIAVLFVLVAGSIIASFTFYKEYKDKIEYIEQQTVNSKTRVEGVESKVDGFKAAIDDMMGQVKSYSDNIKAIQNTLNLSDEERKALMAKLEEMKKGLQDWQKDYSTTVIDIKQGMLSLKDELDKARSKSRDIELGKITVKQEEKSAAAPAPAPAAAPSAAAPAEQQVKKAATSNFRSGGLRKIGT